jgi:hypothetical protein
MHVQEFSLGSIRIDGVTHEHDVVIDPGEVRKRKKKASKKFRDKFGHTPLSAEERIPWKCRRLVVGTGAPWYIAGDERSKAGGGTRNIDLLIIPTAEAIEALNRDPQETNAILHVTC